MTPHHDKSSFIKIRLPYFRVVEACSTLWERFECLSVLENSVVKILFAAIIGIVAATLVVTVTTISLSSVSSSPVNKPLYNYGTR